MAITKISSRQKMINMMYLVLTALLAMNVSREVLNAFSIVGSGIQTSNAALQQRNMDIYETFDKIAAKDTSVDILELYALSLDTRAATESTLDFITQLQTELRNESGMKEVDGALIFKSPDDVNTGTKLLTEANNGTIKGEELRLQLLSLRDEYLKIIDEGNRTIPGTDMYKDYKTQYASMLPLEALPATVIGKGKEKKKWHEFNFYEVPVIATDVILDKLKNDIIATEAQVLQYLKDQMKIELPDFDQLNAAVIAPKSYLASGHTYESEIFIAANSSKQKVEVFVGKLDKAKFLAAENDFLFTETDELPFVGDYQILPVVNGKAKFEAIASGVGKKTYEGVIRLKKPNGGYEIYPFQSDYEVAPPSGISISPTMMNVLYVGIDNPVSITVGGTKSDADVYPEITQGNLQRNGNGQYIARVTTPGEAQIKVNATVNDQMQSFPPMVFRVKRVPDPNITLCGGKSSGTITMAQLNACSGLVAKADNFEFDANFRVVSFKMGLLPKSGNNLFVENSGPAFGGQANNLKAQVTTGDRIYFDNIVVLDPANERRKLQDVLMLEVSN